MAMEGGERGEKEGQKILPHVILFFLLSASSLKKKERGKETKRKEKKEEERATISSAAREPPHPPREKRRGKKRGEMPRLIRSSARSGDIIQGLAEGGGKRQKGKKKLDALLRHQRASLSVQIKEGGKGSERERKELTSSDLCPGGKKGGRRKRLEKGGWEPLARSSPSQFSKEKNLL